MWDSYDESMTLRLLDEANYDAEMESKVLPALDACMTEGWMDPATVDWPVALLLLRRGQIRCAA